MPQESPQFETTLWSVILCAAHEPDSSAGRDALERLCRVYWYPVYSFIRRRGRNPVDAEDLTQGFFAQILRNGFLRRADPERGRFRAFLLNAVKNHLSDERARANAERRGGTAERISFDGALAEQWLALEPSAVNDAAVAFDRSWALTLVNHALGTLEAEQRDQGKAENFAVLKAFLQRPPDKGEYESVATQLGMRKGAVATAVHRLGERYREIVRKAVKDTVASVEMADEELRFLLATLSN